MPSISDDDRLLLLRIARASIADRLDPATRLPPLLDESARRPSLGRPAACFVTLTVPDEPAGPAALRGCIGDLEASAPLDREVARCAELAAFHDPRFPPLDRAELERIRIAISVLASPRPIARPEEIVLGRDGVVVARDGRRGVFLPEVALEQGWSADVLLERLCRKAGLPKGAWREAALSAFTTEAFEEDPIGPSVTGAV